MKVLYIALIIILGSCINNNETADDSTSNSETIVGSSQFIYSVPTEGIPFTIDSISVIFTQGNSITPFQGPAPALNREFIEYETSLNIGDTVSVYASVWRNDSLIADAADTIIITDSTQQFVGSPLNNLPIISAGADKTIFINNNITFSTAEAEVLEIDDSNVYLWWKSIADSVFSPTTLSIYYSSACTDTIVLKVVDGYGHEVFDTLLVTVQDYDIADLSSSVAVPTDVVSSSAALSSSSVILSSVEAISSSLLSSSAVVSSSEIVVVSSSEAVVVSSSSASSSSEAVSSAGPLLYELTVDGGTGSGFYEAGTVVDIVANANDTGMCFYEWVGYDVADEIAFSTTLVMPASNIIILNDLFNCWELTILYDDAKHTDTTVTLSWGVEHYIYWEPPMDPRLGWTCIAEWSHPHNGESMSIYSPNLNTDSLFIQTPLLSSTYHHGKDTITKVGESCK
ncbi:MAG: hypothetical protein OCD01_16455 [Fibrobacterales bacterium]